MNDLNNLLKTIKSSFSKRKKVDFEESNLHFELEPLNSLDEMKVMEACKDIEGAAYIEALKKNSLACSIKKVNDMDFSGPDVTYTDENGKEQEKSTFLFMTEFLSEWPSSLIDVLFEAFTDMQTELEAKLKKDVKFERFIISEKPEEDQPEKFRKIKENENVPEMTETERLDKKVKEEIDKEDMKISESEMSAKSNLNE